MEQEAEIRIGEERVVLLGERALHWPAADTLIVSDLHWGKTETFHQHGVPIPGGLFEADLQRLTRALQRTRAQRLVVLGDLIHGKLGLTADLIARLQRWRKENPVAFTVTAGNHDRSLARVAGEWNLELCDVLREGPFVFRHEAQSEEGGFTWWGHLHPTFVMASAAQSLRLPCFHIGKNAGILPAFSDFTRGVKVKKQPGDRVFVVVNDSVAEV